MPALSLGARAHRLAISLPTSEFQRPNDCPLDSCAALHAGTMELERLQQAEASLSASLARERLLVEQKDELIRHKDLLGRESDHRLMNGLQMVTSLLTMQSRLVGDEDCAAQLRMAANRVAMIGRVHRSLHALDNIASVDLTGYLTDLCKDMSTMLSADNNATALVVEGIALKVPSAIGIPLGFVVSELVTNSAKYAVGKITVRVAADPGGGYALSVTDRGKGLPKDFDPTKTKGLGMRIVMSLVQQIGGKLRFSSREGMRGTRFTVQCTCEAASAAAA